MRNTKTHFILYATYLTPKSKESISAYLKEHKFKDCDDVKKLLAELIRTKVIEEKSLGIYECSKAGELVIEKYGKPIKTLRKIRQGKAKLKEILSRPSLSTNYLNYQTR